MFDLRWTQKQTALFVQDGGVATLGLSNKFPGKWMYRGSPA